MDKVALITGGSRGIGFGIAEKLAKDGFKLAINGTRAASEVQATIDQLKKSGRDVIYCQGSVSSTGDRQRILGEIKNHYGELHVLVNNAGIAPRERKDILDNP